MRWLDKLLGKRPAMRQDTWVNPYTGFGTARDRMIASQYTVDALLTTTELDSLYYGSDVASKIVDFRPKEMFRRGYEVRIDGSDDDAEEQANDEETEQDPEIPVAVETPAADGSAQPSRSDADYTESDSEDTQNSDIPDQLMAKARELDLDKKLLSAMIWGRLYGGCLVILGLNDGQDMSQPLNEDKIRELLFIHVVDRRYALAMTYYADPLHPKFGMPETYQVGDPMFGNWSVVHESRCLRFEGVEVDARRRRQNAGWGHSVLQRPYESMRDFSTAFKAAGFMLSDASQGVFKLHGLIDAIASKQEAAIQARMQLVDMSRGVARSVLLDAGNNEEFSKVSTTFAGVSDMLDRFMLRLAAAADMPVTILMGRSPAGLNATGESDFRAFYATVESEQKNFLKPILQRVYTLIATSLGIRGIDGLDFYFCPLWSPTDKEQADLELVVAQKDQIYINMGVLHPSEVAMSRYGGGQFSQSTEIDVESRKKELKNDIKMALAPPPPPPPALVPGQKPPNAPPQKDNGNLAPDQAQAGQAPVDTAAKNRE